ncbi:hypothetical protein AX774_g931 [Zancudomyces culisetae]|uniref:Uncharacterized protein n=1 Tax=Zancudomyces culisetae TaxID=1213189 RepID=A0A1R1PX87_ZANCU|nr:hypothetical protein AX774_g3591 [Zancudomyces culisetae]OMH85542.1 hypothetical protein AX774_g931 [Zancudomyces culisetae]|eukprot:OMH82915.1 hypothetical protein AX774_g3591 [Zancudomyces culisetae]
MLLQKAQGLTHLVVGGIYSNSGAVLKNITPKHLPKLQSLELREHSTPGQFNSFLNQNWESITQLSTFAFLMPPETSKIIGASFKNLQSLNFTEIQMITPENMNLILKSYSKQLEKIQLCACGIDISEAWSPDLEWKRLKRATLVNTGITTAMLESLLTSEMLNEIEIAASALSDEKELLKLLESPKSNLLTKNLEVLIIRGLNGLSARGVKALIERFKMSLHEVEIAGIDISKKECQMLREKYGTISFFFASDQHMPPEMMEALQRMQQMEMEGHEHGGGGGGCCGGHGMPAMSNNNPLMAMLGQGMMGGPSLADGEIDVISGVQFANPLSKSPQLKEVRMGQAGSNEGSWEDENMSDEEGGINDVD